jgi:hypothetical protein
MQARSAGEVAGRVVALIAVIDEARQDQVELMHSWVARFAIARHFTPNEAQFFAARGGATRAVRVDFSWRAEGLLALIWALGGIEDMPSLERPNEHIDSPLLTLAAQSPDDFLAQAQLRPLAQIEAMKARLIEAMRQLRGARSAASEWDPAVVYERCNALAWLLDDEEDWD